MDPSQYIDGKGPFDLHNCQNADIKKMLQHCYEHKVSDVCFKTGQPVYAKKDGRMMRVTQLPLEGPQIERVAVLVSRNEAIMSLLKSGHDYDTGFHIMYGRREFINFRVNITGISSYMFELSIILRSIPGAPPALEDLGLEKEFTDNFFPKSGLVLVCGPTGSGKTTLLASGIQHLLNTQPCKVGTYEAPIEFYLAPQGHYPSMVTQVEIGPGRNLESFDRAAANALRNAHDVVMLGEARDFETLRGLAQLAEQGTCAYATLHTESSYQCFSRIYSTIGEDNKALMLSFIGALRLVVHQRLVPHKEKGRVALREYLILDEEARDRISHNIGQGISEVAKELNKKKRYGVMLDESARRAYEQGLISEHTRDMVIKMRS